MQVWGNREEEPNANSTVQITPPPDRKLCYVEIIQGVMVCWNTIHGPVSLNLQHGSFDLQYEIILTSLTNPNKRHTRPVESQVRLICHHLHSACKSCSFPKAMVWLLDPRVTRLIRYQNMTRPSQLYLYGPKSQIWLDALQSVQRTTPSIPGLLIQIRKTLMGKKMEETSGRPTEEGSPFQIYNNVTCTK